MNREIKFRGKRIDNGEWIYGLLLYFEDEYGIQPSYGCKIHEVVPETIGQFTGLIDMGKEIYEGDIAVYQLSNKGINEDFKYLSTKQLYELFPDNFRMHVVCWDNVEYAFALDYRGRTWYNESGDRCTMNGMRSEVIGNVHDNPELLTKND